MKTKHTSEKVGPRVYKLFVPIWLEQAYLTSSQYRVYCHLSSRGEGRCYPSLDIIAECCRLKRATVIRAIRELEQMGLIKRQKRKSNGARNSNEYLLISPKTEAPDKKQVQKGTRLKRPKRKPFNGAVLGPGNNTTEKETSVSESCGSNSSPKGEALSSAAEVESFVKALHDQDQRNPNGTIGMFPFEDVFEWAQQWFLLHEQTGWLYHGDPIMNREASLRSYLNGAAKRQSKRFRELSGAGCSSGNEPPF
jgi:DNA-binding Lrp family transcriptional regulator